MGDFIDREAQLDSEEEEHEEHGENDEESEGEGQKQKNGANARRRSFGDSSDEEDDDDAEEAQRVAAGFIVSDTDEDEEDGEDGGVKKSKRKKKRRRSQRSEAEDEDEGLDEEDLDLMMENTGEGTKPSKSQFKRLKRGREEGRGREEDRDLDHMFASDDEDAPGDLEDEGRGYDNHRDTRDEFQGFIEESSGDEDDRGGESDDDMRVGNRRKHVVDTEMLGLREGAMADMRDIFSMDEYEGALVTEQETAEMEEKTQDLQLKDVFEPSELAERLLTDEDNEIRWKDVPERMQLLRKPFATQVLTPEEQLEEANWIASNLLQRKHFDRDLSAPFLDAVRKVLDLFNVENYEVPFIHQQRKDYLIHTVKIPRKNVAEGEPAYDLENEKMIYEKDLWAILDFDLKFRAFVDKRNSFKRLYINLKEHNRVEEDSLVEERLRTSDSIDQVQDLHDYVQFKYQSELKDYSVFRGENQPNTHRKPGAGRNVFERIRAGAVYNLVNAFGITSDQFAVNVQTNKKREFAEDPSVLPHELADQYTQYPEFPTGDRALQAAKVMLAEEIYMNPRMRAALRQRWFTRALIHVNPTEKGIRQIDEQHQYYEFKYLRNQSLSQIAVRPSMFLKMAKAELDGLIEIKVELEDYPRFMRDLYEFIVSDNYSEVADAWNAERKEAVDIAMKKFTTMFNKHLLDELKNACEDEVTKEINEEYARRLDQAPFKPKALSLGEVPRVCTISNGQGERGRDAIVVVFFDEYGVCIGHTKVDNLKEEDNRDNLANLIKKRRPDVIGVAGFSVETNRLFEDLRKLVDEKDITVQDEDEDRSPMEVLFVNDEVARLYHNSERAKVDHPDMPPLARYCCALARYLQNPLLEYAALGKDIVSLSFHPAQGLIGEDKLKRTLESAMVDMVNLVGVQINEAVNKPYIANLLPYVCGLGPRKASSVLKIISSNGGKVANRQELLGVGRDITPAVGPKVFENCASFLIIPHAPKEPDSDYFDGTRVHPEEYELGCKMCADALDLDEEDVADLVSDAGKGAVVNKLVKGNLDRLNELILEEYAEELERNFNQKKRATLEAIRGELQAPYEELRGRFLKLSPEEVFTMLTGETKWTLDEGMIVSVNIRRVTDRYVSARLDCGIEGNVSVDEMPMDAINMRPTSFYHVGQTLQARIESLNRKSFYSELTFREDKIRKPVRRNLDMTPEEWDDVREEQDKARLAIKNQEQTRTARVIKHPLFKAFNSRQAEEYLSGQSRGDVVIRPSSLGHDHIAITWKVADNIYQHLDVLELDKRNEFTVGQTLRVGKHTYSDLDELVVYHVKAMASKVDELCHNPKFQTGTKEDAEKWLEKYCEANPKRSSYAFCLDSQHPGYFMLLFKAGAAAKIGIWHVKVIPNAFEMRKTTYPDVGMLCNGFKTMHTHQMQRGAGGRPRM